MRDHELYTTILGLQAPWTVERVEVDLPGKAVHVWLGRTDDTPAPCPECHIRGGTLCPYHPSARRGYQPAALP